MSPPLVGRDRELAALTDAVTEAAQGRGGVVLLTGEPGVGKTRLAREAIALARRQGFTIAEGQADPVAAVPYAPIVQALRRLLAALPGPDVAWLAPDLGQLFADPRLAPPVAAGDPHVRRTRLYESALALITRLAMRRPVLLSVDDLHHADRGTVELLHYIGRNSRDLPVLVIVCYRPGAGTDLLDAMAAAARRDPGGRQWDLEPLDDTEDLVRRVAGEPSPAVARSVASRAGGIPLFAVALAEADGALPEVVRDTVLDRVCELTREDRRLLDVITVAGVLGRLHVLRTVAELDGPRLAAALHRLVDGRLVAEHRTGAEVYYRVRHPLYAEVLYDALGEPRRRALHAAVGAAVDNAEHTMAVAWHYAAGGDEVPADRAITVLGEAGRRALDVREAGEATEYLGAALRRARVSMPELVPDLLAELARARHGIGRADEPIELLRQAVALGELRGQDAARRRAWQELLALLEEERGIVPGTDPPVQLVMHWLLMLRAGDPAELAMICGRLTELPDSPTGRSLARLGSGVLAALAGDFASACAELTSAVELAQLCGDDAVAIAIVPRLLLSGFSVVRGDLATAVRVVDADGTRLPVATAHVHVTLAFARYFAGELPAATVQADSAVTEARRNGQDGLAGRALALRAFLHAERGDLARASADLASARTCFTAAQVDLPDAIDLAATAVALLSGTPSEAPAFTDARPFGDPQLTCLRLAFAGYAAVAAGDVTEADRVTGLLRLSFRDAPLVDALVERQEGLTAVLRGEHAEAATSLRHAAAVLHELGAVLLAAQTSLDLAELVPAAEAGELVRSAAAVFATAEAGAWSVRAARMARTSGQLTRRESEIATLVGAGLSNADIAVKLFLSERTVETHLRNIYRKLELKSRISLARWARH